jgi:hypothetical protein
MERLTVEKIMEMVENGNGNFGVRGLSGSVADKKYRLNQYMACSFDTFDDAPISTAGKLDGTCAISIDDSMDEDDIKERIAMAKEYAKYSGGRVVLIWGDTESYDTDGDEAVVIGNECLKTWSVRGAKYLGEVDA